MNQEDPRWSVLLDFLEQAQADANSGSVRPLEHYLARFPGFEDLLREEYGRLQLGSATDAPKAGSTSASSSAATSDLEMIELLRARGALPSRYVRAEEIGRGGMSRVYLARDLELERELAMKVHQGSRASALRRFVREARVLGRLDHPGVLPIHELGLDYEGRVYFTMQLVRGVSLKQRFDELRVSTDLGARRAALESILRVCDTMAFAHSQGIIHRDLKPSNVMLGEFGAVYVVDWGLARIESRAGESESTFEAEATLEAELPMETLAGDVLGTPAYMPPEQARGALDEVGPRSDLYSVGAILYHLLAGRAPFHEGDTTPGSREIIARVVSGGPSPLAQIAHGAAPELISICERAMARAVDQRYSSCAQMASDLRAYLDGRVVLAHRTGTLTRARKWIARNRALASASAGVLVIAAAALLTWRKANAREQDLDLLADLRGPLELLDEYGTLWPATPERKIVIEQWLARADQLRGRGELYQRQLDTIRSSAERLPDSSWISEEFQAQREAQLAAALAARDETMGRLELAERGEGQPDGPSAAILRSNVDSLKRGISVLSARPDHKPETNFADSHLQLLNDRLDQFLAELDFVIGRSEDRMRVRLARSALTLVDRVDLPATAENGLAWGNAVNAIHAAAPYKGFVLKPQRGLIPLGPDPRSGLWEFAHLQSGRVPVRGADGNLQLTPDAAIVLVLIPAGMACVGAQRADLGLPNYDPMAERFEGPPLQQPVLPFFLSKYELTIEQWCAITGANPVDSHRDINSDPQAVRMPQAAIDGRWSQTVLGAYGLELPTSIGWEYAARAGTNTPWWTGADRASIEGAGNVADKRWLSVMHDPYGYAESDIGGAVDFDDGYIGCAPVGSFKPNAFGLHDTIGNVSEWCRDQTLPYLTTVLIEGAELFRYPLGLQIVRGGSAGEGAFASRSAARMYMRPELTVSWLGLRPARRLER